MHKKVGHTKTLRILQRDVIFLMLFCALTTAASSQTVTMRNEGVSVSVVGVELNVFGDVVSEQVSAQYNLDGNLSLSEDWVNNASSNLFPNLGTPSGSVVFITGNNQGITGTFATNFNGLEINKLGGTVDLLKPTAVYAVFDLTSGIVVSNSSNSLLLKDNITVTGGSSSSFVSGPILKEGDDAFLFPVGKGNNYQPITMSAPGLATDVFTAEYFDTEQTAGSALDAGLASVSSCEHWLLDRTNGTSIVDVTLGWNSNSCDIAVLADKRVAQWDGVQWVNYGNGGTTGTVSNGTMISSSGSPITTYGFFALGDNVLTLQFTFPIAPEGGFLLGGGSNIFIHEETRVTVLGDIAVGGPGGSITNGGKIRVQGNWRNEASADIFSTMSGSVEFFGSVDKAVKGTNSVNFNQVKMNKSAGTLTLEQPVDIESGLELAQGNIETSDTSPILLKDDGVVVGGSEDSYVSGPFSKRGDDAFNFPIGRPVVNGVGGYHPINVSGTSNSGDELTAQYFPVEQTEGKALDGSLSHISTCENWTVSSSSTDPVIVSLTWNQNSCDIINIPNLRVAQWTGTNWQGIGNVGFTGTISGGTITASAPVAVGLIPPRTFGIGIGPPPTVPTPVNVHYALLKKRLDGGFYMVHNGSLRFKYHEEYATNNDFLDYRIYRTNDHDLYFSGTVSASPTISGPPLSVSYGDNWYELALASYGVAQGNYILETINQKGEKSYLRFVY